MKTKMYLILLPVVLVIASTFMSSNSVGIAAEKGRTIYVKSQEIVIGGGSVCADLDPINQCWEKFTDCKGKELPKIITREEVFKIVSGGTVKLILGPSLSCDSFIVDVEGNTKYCCTPRKCYVCG